MHKKSLQTSKTTASLVKQYSWCSAGESHLVECTAFQAGQILGRRKAKLESAINTAKRELQQSGAQLHSASDQLLSGAGEGAEGGVMEIIEDYDPAMHGPLGNTPADSTLQHVMASPGQAISETHSQCPCIPLSQFHIHMIPCLLFLHATALPGRTPGHVDTPN